MAIMYSRCLIFSVVVNNCLTKQTAAGFHGGYMDMLREMFAEIKIEIILKIGIRVFLTLLFSWVVAKILKRFLLRLEKRLISKSAEGAQSPSESEKRVETIVRLIRQGVMITLYIAVFLVVLKEIGIDIAPIVASAGIVGVAVGFGAQNMIRDIIAGVFIILENQIRVGDFATINGTGGHVESINFRTIILRDSGGTVHIFPNGTITTMSNSTYGWSAYLFEIGVAYKENTDHVIKIMAAVGEELFHDEVFGSNLLEVPEIFGVDKLDDSAVIIQGRIKTKPIRQWEVGREYLRRIKMAFDKHKIEMPFPQRTLSFAEGIKSFEMNKTEKTRKKK